MKAKPRRIVRHYIYDADGNLFTMRDIAKIVDRNASTVTCWFLENNYKTILDFIEHTKKLKVNPRGISRRLTIFDTCHGRLNALQIAEIVGMSRTTVYARALTYGYDSPAMFYPKGLTKKQFKELLVADGLIGKVSTYNSTQKKPVIINVHKEFDRTLCCFRDHVECEHYSSCTDSVLFKGGQHQRFKKDWTCYTAKEAKHYKVYNGSQQLPAVTSSRGGFSE